MILCIDMNLNLCNTDNARHIMQYSPVGGDGIWETVTWKGLVSSNHMLYTNISI